MRGSVREARWRRCRAGEGTEQRPKVWITVVYFSVAERAAVG